MKDMLGRNVNVGDEVVHIHPNANGKQSITQGRIVGFNKKGAIILTKEGVTVAVKNIILHRRDIRNINLFDFLKQVFH